MAIRNNTDYIKLIICAKRILLSAGMILLPYIISSKVMRTTTRKIISKKDTSRFERSTVYEGIKDKYNADEKIMQKIWELMGTITSSVFEVIDYDTKNHCAGVNDKKPIPIINEIICEELLFFVTMI